MVYTLDIKSGLWSAAPLEGEEGPIVELPDDLAKRDALLATLEEMGVPGVLARAMCRPKTEFDNWSADGAVAGDCPEPRKRFTIEIMGGIIYVYGGCDDDTVSDDLEGDAVYLGEAVYLAPMVTVPLILALVPATVTTAVRTLMSDLNELRSRGVEEQANARILALELYLKNKNQGHGVGFVAFELVLDRRMLKQVAVVV